MSKISKNMMNNIRISVIIPTYKRPESLLNTLNSLLEQDIDEFEIVVIDNDPQSDLKSKLCTIRNNTKIEIRYIQERNIGLHYARNTGAVCAKGEILLYTDDDTIMPENWVSSIIEPFNDSRIGAVGGKVIPKWEMNPPEWILRYSSGNLSLLDLGPEPIILNANDIKIYGCNMAIRKSIVVENGGFHPELIGDIYYGDGETGFLRKIQARGWLLMYYPKACLWHVINKQRLTVKYMCRRYKNQGASDAFSYFSDKNKRHYFHELKWLVVSLLKIFTRTLLMILYVNQPEKYMKNLFKSGYQKGRLFFMLKYLLDNRYRAVVHEKNWIKI